MPIQNSPSKGISWGSSFVSHGGGDKVLCHSWIKISAPVQQPLTPSIFSDIHLLRVNIQQFTAHQPVASWPLQSSPCERSDGEFISVGELGSLLLESAQLLGGVLGPDLISLGEWLLYGTLCSFCPADKEPRLKVMSCCISKYRMFFTRQIYLCTCFPFSPRLLSVAGQNFLLMWWISGL